MRVTEKKKKTRGDTRSQVEAAVSLRLFKKKKRERENIRALCSSSLPRVFQSKLVTCCFPFFFFLEVD